MSLGVGEPLFRIALSESSSGMNQPRVNGVVESVGNLFPTGVTKADDFSVNSEDLALSRSIGDYFDDEDLEQKKTGDGGCRAKRRKPTSLEGKDAKLVELYRNGLSAKRVSVRLGVTQGAVYRRLHELDVKTRGRGQGQVKKTAAKVFTSLESA